MNEQRNFIMAVDRLYARVHALRDAAYGDDWDDKLTVAWGEFQEAVNEGSAILTYLR